MHSLPKGIYTDDYTNNHTEKDTRSDSISADTNGNIAICVRRSLSLKNNLIY